MTSFLDTFQARFNEWWVALFQHIQISLLALILAIAIALPLAILVMRTKKMKELHYNIKQGEKQISIQGFRDSKANPKRLENSVAYAFKIDEIKEKKAFENPLLADFNLDVKEKENSMKKQTKHITINRETIENLKDYFWKIVEPIFWTGNIYGTYAEYEKSLENFSTEQRYLFAMNWLDSEVNNGGFPQFFENSTGIVWEDAYKGYQAAGATEMVNLMDRLLAVYGKNPSFDREERWNEIDEETMDKIDEFSSEYYKLEEFYEQIVLWIKANPEKFYFEGDVEAGG